MKKPFMNFVVDHMTFLVEPRFYPVTYALFRIIFGLGDEDIIYNKRRKWPGENQEKSMTFAARLGRYEGKPGLDQSIVAVVQPSEPDSQPSHVREMLKTRGGSAHWQHIALRTPDLISFHEYAAQRGVNFITPILKDAEEDLIQVFSGEWKLPQMPPSGIFFEFVQRNPSKELLEKISSNREAFFRDKTFLGLYQEKEAEYQSKKVRPFIDDELFLEIEKSLAGKPIWELNNQDFRLVEEKMKDYARSSKLAR
jgi:hypothetical protein